MVRRLIGLLVLLTAFLLLQTASAEEYRALLQTKNGTVEICSTENENGSWLFLPSFTDLSELKIVGLTEKFALETTEEEGIWQMDVSGETLKIMKSQNLRALFLFSDDSLHAGREYVDGSELHSEETTGTIALVNKDGCVDYVGRMDSIRGRGNSTWLMKKKPYQIKLKDKVDLLQTGDPSERNRTWILLADAVDASLLHNRIALDMAKEMGLLETAHCEHVDLYYDGEYRGTYLLTEKVEIGEGRSNERDYGKIIKKWNKWIGQYDLDALPQGEGENLNGDPVRYVEGLADNNVYNAGAYLVEMYARGRSGARSGFTLAGDRAFEITNPEYASKEMVCYVSELMSDGLAALQNGGFHPQTGEPVEKWFDLESFARAILLNDVFHNWDAFILTSTYFMLSAGETQFQAGPLWDFDRTMRNPPHALEAGYTWGLKDRGDECWASEFYTVPAFMRAARNVYAQEIYPLIQGILLGKENGRYLRTLDEYVGEIRASALMNDCLWPEKDVDVLLHYADSFDTEVEYLRRFLKEQSDWFYQVFVLNGESDADHINITMEAEWLYVEEPLHFSVFPWSRVVVQSYHHEQLTEATEDEYALWKVELILAPDQGYSFESPQVLINNGWFAGDINPDGTLTITFCFEDHSYRPFEFEGEDIGMIFNPDYYAHNYPEVAKACEDDPELLAEHFCYEGMYEAYTGNGFFDPALILLYHPLLERSFGEDWPSYYWDFLYYGYEYEGWMESTDVCFVPPVLSCSEE